MAASCCSLSFGRRTLEARQPRWLRVPVNGAEPTTLPVRRTLARIKTFLQHDAAAFGFLAHGFDGEIFAHDLGAAFVHHAGGRADVGVGMAAQVFLGKVDQARFALQQGQQLQGGVRRGFFQDDGGGGRRRHGSRCRGTGATGAASGRDSFSTRAA